MAKVIDLSMDVHGDMVVFPRVARPVIAMVEDWEEFARGIGAAEYGTTWLTASCVVVQGDQVKRRGVAEPPHRQRSADGGSAQRDLLGEPLGKALDDR